MIPNTDELAKIIDNHLNKFVLDSLYKDLYSASNQFKAFLMVLMMLKYLKRVASGRIYHEYTAETVMALERTACH